MLLALAGLACPPPADADVVAVVVGIDDYEHVIDLDGAVADARDLAGAFDWLGGRTALLLERDASRESLLGLLDEAVASAAPDDVVVFSFAGHGIQVPDLDGDEADGFDEAFVLADYQPGEEDRNNLILDDEIEPIIARAAPRVVVFVADSCFSGTMLRGVDPRADFRKVRALPRTSFGSARAPASPGAPPADDMPGNLVFFGAVPEHLGVQEVLIDGRPRGALSYAVARAVQGRADRDQDGLLTGVELVSQVTELVRVISEGRQTPNATSGEASRGVLFPLPAVEPSAAPSSSPAPATPLASAGPTDRPLRLAVRPADDGMALLDRLRGVEIVAGPETADLIFEASSGDLLTSGGDVAARLGPARGVRLVQGIIDKWRLLASIEGAVDGSLEARVLPDDVAFPNGTPFVVRIKANTAGRLVLFDLASDGSVIVLAPPPGQPAATLGPGETMDLRLRAGPPFGADHLVAALLPADRVDQLVGLLRNVHGRPLSLDEAGRLERLLRPAGPLPIAVYTEP